MKNIFFNICACISMLILLVNCASKKEANKEVDQKILLNGVWELSDISSVKNINKEFSQNLPTLIFENKNGLTAFGNDGCNQYQTEVFIKKNNTLEVKPNIALSKIFCNKVNSELYIKNLTEANSFDVSENILKLNTPTDTLKFYRVSLEGKWVLDKLNTVKTKFNDLYPYKKPFINININSNQVTGNTACNSVTAHFLIFENKMTFNHVLTTKMFCDGTGEKDFTDALARTTNYELKGTRLVLYENNKIIMEFKRDYE